MGVNLLQYPISKFPFYDYDDCNGMDKFLYAPKDGGIPPIPSDEECLNFANVLACDKGFAEFHDRYTKYVSALFNSAGSYPYEIPGFRIHRRDHLPFYSGIQESKYVIYTPLTPMFYTNSIAVESQYGLGDYNFINMKIGDLYILDKQYRRVIDNFHNGMGQLSICMMSFLG